MSEYQKSNAPKSTITRDNVLIEKKVNGNIFESLVVAGKRASQIQINVKRELTERLEEFKGHTDSLEEMFENREQIEVSKIYEKMPKPHAIALQELMEDKLFWRKAGDVNPEA